MSKERELIQRAQQLALEASYIIGDAKPEFTKLCADLDEYLSKPEQEQAVAWLITHHENQPVLTFNSSDYQSERFIKTPLYAHPPKREPLSDDDIARLWGEKFSGETLMIRNFARAIEKVHGITDEC